MILGKLRRQIVSCSCFVFYFFSFSIRNMRLDEAPNSLNLYKTVNYSAMKYIFEMVFKNYNRSFYYRIVNESCIDHIFCSPQILFISYLADKFVLVNSSIPVIYK